MTPNMYHLQKDTVINSVEGQLQRFAARFGTGKSTGYELDLITSKLMEEYYFFEEFLELDDNDLNFEEKSIYIRKIFNKLDWLELDEKQEFIFMTGVYAEIGSQNDLLAYYAICEWMSDVGNNLDNRYSNHFVGDVIGASKIYGSFYSPCKYTGYDFIPSITDPKQTNWDQLGEFRPTIVFSEWLENNTEHKRYKPINLDLLLNFRLKTS